MVLVSVFREDVMSSMPTTLTENLPGVDRYTETLRDRAWRFEDDADPCVRARIATEVYRDKPDLPVVRKRAEILARTLETLAPIVLPEERLVGVAFHRMRVHGGVSDSDAWRIQVMHPERHGFNPRWPIDEETREELKWWKGRNSKGRNDNALRKENPWLQRYALAGPHGFVGAHTLPDHGILLNNGIGELRRRIEQRLETAKTTKERDQLRAMDRCLEGLSGHCRLCAETARAKAGEVEDPTLRERLIEAADRCEAVSEAAPASFAEALQLLFFSNHADCIDTSGDASSFGRVDQLLAPFYAADTARGVLTREDAFDLVCHFLIKRWAAQTSINMTVGGLKPDGADATNDLSFIFLEAMEATGVVANLTARLHRDAPEAFVRTAVRVVRRSFGRPSLFNDDVTVEALTRKGVAPEDARDYAPLGCVEVMIPGRTAHRTMGMGMNLMKVLELTLNQGRCLVSGDTVWDDVPDRFETFEQLYDEYRSRVRAIVDLGVKIIREDERIEPGILPRPWLTVLSRGGIEDARDLTDGQPRYDPVGVTLIGLADVVDSLYALRRLVFEEKRVTLEELREVLRADWEGHEALRLPRFGQDDEAINRIARDEAAFYAECFEEHRTLHGGRFWPMIFGVSTGMLTNQNPKTGATPSGRRNGAALAMSLQPNLSGAQGCLTAILRSAASIDFRDYPGGISNVQECDPSHVEGEDGLDRLTGLVRGFLDLGGMELSLNFLDQEKLRAAQADPDRHSHLMVRLFGLSAHFVNLSPELQESVIERVAAAARRQGGP
jgi:pyruvate-formate lyase